MGSSGQWLIGNEGSKIEKIKNDHDRSADDCRTQTADFKDHHKHTYPHTNGWVNEIIDYICVIYSPATQPRRLHPAAFGPLMHVCVCVCVCEANRDEARKATDILLDVFDRTVGVGSLSDIARSARSKPFEHRHKTRSALIFCRLHKIPRRSFNCSGSPQTLGMLVWFKKDGENSGVSVHHLTSCLVSVPNGALLQQRAARPAVSRHFFVFFFIENDHY